MCYKNNLKRIPIILSVLSMVLFNQSMQQAYASADLRLDERRHDRHDGYNEVVVGSDRYYYNEGVFYRGEPGHYVAVEAPAGAVVDNVPSSYERVEVDGTPYLRYHNVYYRHAGRGYEVVRIDNEHEHGDHKLRGDDHRDDHHDDRQDEHHGE